MSQGRTDCLRPTQDFTDEETARRRDETIKRMIATPPQPHKPLGKPKLIKKVSPKNPGRAEERK